jgi:hypothetical protein
MGRALTRNEKLGLGVASLAVGAAGYALYTRSREKRPSARLLLPSHVRPRHYELHIQARPGRAEGDSGLTPLAA